jgi:hypothetical protein
MGRKVHPIGMRLGINQGWQGRWFAEGSQYRQQLHQDFAIRGLLMGTTSKGGSMKDTDVRKLRKELPDTIKNGKAGISSDASNDITALSMTNGTLTPTFAATTYNYSCAATGNVDITATFAAGTAKVHVDGTYFETLATTVKGGAITMAAGNNKIIQIVVQESGKAAKTYTIMCQRAAL